MKTATIITKQYTKDGGVYTSEKSGIEVISKRVYSLRNTKTGFSLSKPGHPTLKVSFDDMNRMVNSGRIIII